MPKLTYQGNIIQAVVLDFKVGIGNVLHQLLMKELWITQYQ